MICLFLVPALVAAIWAWRMAEGSGKYNVQEKTREVESLKNELEMAMGDLNEAKYRRIHDASLHADTVHKLNKEIEAIKNHSRDLAKTIEEWKFSTNTRDLQIKTLQNQIDGLEIDKIHLKYELGVHREKQQKRRDQKAASMRRFRAKNKEAKK